MAKKGMDPTVMKAVFWIAAGVFVWLNDSYAWLSWPKAIAVILVVGGLKKFCRKSC